MGVVRLRSSVVFSAATHFFLIVIWTCLVGYRATITPAQRAPTTWIVVDAANDSLKIAESIRSKRVVQTRRGHEVEKALPNAFLGERNQVVDRETVSKNRTTTMGSRSRAQAKRDRAERRAEIRTKALATLGVGLLPKGALKARSDDDDRNWAGGEGLPQDYVRGLKEGERTALNTREYVFYGYFQRIRQRLDLAWTRILRDQLLKLYRGGRRHASDMDHTTKVLVTLDSGGMIVRVQVLEASGSRDLDDAAVRAFNRAGPFPNPPKGLVDAGGTIQVRWDFVLKS